MQIYAYLWSQRGAVGRQREERRGKGRRGEVRSGVLPFDGQRERESQRGDPDDFMHGRLHLSVSNLLQGDIFLVQACHLHIFRVEG